MTRVWFLIAAISAGCVHDRVHLGGELPTTDAGKPEAPVDASLEAHEGGDRDADGGMREGNQQNSGSQHR